MVVKYRFRLYLFTLALLVGFGALSQRLWNLSVERHEEFINKVPGTKVKRARIPGVRGEIRDRNGIQLVSNKPSYEVRINLKTLVDEYKKQIEIENKHLPKDQKLSIPVHEYQYYERGLPRKKDEIDIVALVDEVIIGSLNRLGLAAPYNANQLRVHYRTHRGVVPWVYRSDLTFEQFSQFAEHRLGLPGLTVAARPVRQYLYDSMACHLLGYVSLPDEQKVSEEEKKEWDFYVPDDYGVSGIEKYFDSDLRGRPGVRSYLENEKGRLVKEIETSYQESRRGHDVYLTLDARIQFFAERALRESTPAIGRGSVVVLQPATGEVLAMASVPSYNPNKFIPAISRTDFQAYLGNTAVPLLNRSVRTFAPGSTYKVMIGFAGILAGTEKDRWNCSGGVNYGNKYMKCWIASKGGSHGTLGLSDALKASCNCYFYQYGNHAGIANIVKAGKMFGMGQKTGIELEEEDGGILPSPEWLRAHNPLERWSSGSTANTSIGQGLVLASPLQMAGVAATVGNGGIAYKPHLLKKVMDDKDLVREQTPEVRGNFLENGLTAEKLELVRKGMWKVVMDEGGTGKSARIPGVEVAGKTGTAQNWTPDGAVDNHTLFITFAPYVNPKYAVCVIVQGGKSGGGTAAPIAKRVMEQALALENGYTVELTAMPEVHGHFKPIEGVSFGGDVQQVAPVADEDDVAVNDDPPPRPRRRDDSGESRPKVKIKEEADAEGTRAIQNKQPPPRRANFFQRVFGR
jgi:penicillin-binding protein 2